jgi:hypothetical protein
MVVYKTCDEFLASIVGQETVGTQTYYKRRIQALNLIIDALMVQAAAAAGTSNISQYSLNDGQTIISTTYKGPDAISKAILQYETLKNMYLNKMNGRAMRMMDSKNFPHGYY